MTTVFNDYDLDFSLKAQPVIQILGSNIGTVATAVIFTKHESTFSWYIAGIACT